MSCLIANPAECRSRSTFGVSSCALAWVTQWERKSRWQTLSEREIEFVFCREFEIPTEYRAIMAPEPPLEATAHSRFLKERGKKPPAGIPPYLASLYETPLLTPEQEFHLFRKMNFLNYRAAQLRNTFDENSVTCEDLNAVDELLDQSRTIRNRIVQANLRLVVSIARRFVDAYNSFDDLVSDGNMPLIRAVEIFDFTRGYRFSTYATWAVRNTFVRLAPRSRRRSTRYVTGTQELFEGCSEGRITQTEYERQQRHLTSMVTDMLDSLEDRERDLVMSRFGLDDGSGMTKKFREISSDLDISTERVRQIVARALVKLRATMSDADVDESDMDW